LLLICVLWLFACCSLIRVNRSRRRPTLKNRGDVGLGEQDSSANPSVLDAVMAHDPPKRLSANLEHRGCGLCGVNFQKVKIDSVRVLTWETTGKTRGEFSSPSIPER
jgi:hypothetical protein